MRKMVAAAALAAVLCAGCSAARKDAASAGEQPARAQEVQKAAPGLSEDEIVRITAEFAGVAREHAADLFHAKKKAEQATVEFEAYFVLLYRTGEDNQAMLDAAVRTHREAKELIDPLRKLYPYNDAINSMAEAVVQDLLVLEGRKKK